MKKGLKLTSLNEKGVEKLEVKKLQSIKGGIEAPMLEGTCSNDQGSCNNDQTFHDHFADN